MSYSGKDVLYNANLKEILNDIIGQMNNQGGVAVVGSPTIAIGTSSAAKVKNSAFTVVRDGVVSTIAGTETDFTAITDDIADGYGAVYLVYLDSDNAITLLKGTATLLGASAACPSVPSGGLKIGEVKVVTADAAFDASTTLLSSSSAPVITDTYTTKLDVAIDIDDYSEKNWLYHANLEELLQDLIDIVQNDGSARLLTDPDLRIGTDSKAKILYNEVNYIEDGTITTVATGEVAFTETTHDIVDHKEAIYLVYLDDSTVKISKGASVLTSAGGAACPATPTGGLKLGEVKIATEAAAFAANTTLLDAETVTDTYTDKTDEVGTDFDISSYGLENYEYSENFYDLLDDLEENINSVSNDKVLGNPTLAIGSSAPKKVKNSAFDVVRDGVISTVASTETDFTAIDDDLVDGYGAVYLVYLTAANVITILKGTSTLLGASAVCPATPSGGMKIGEVKLVASGDTFDATTDSLADTWITDTYTNKLEVFEEIA